MPDGKLAGVRCVHLSVTNTCLLFGQPERPKVCLQFKATHEFCGDNADQALYLLNKLETETKHGEGM
jgi:hypothetical protein